MVTTKTQPLEKQKTLNLLNNFFEHFKKCCNQKELPQVAAFENILSPHFLNHCNGKQIGKNLQDFQKRIQDVKNRYSHVELPKLNTCLIADNKAVIHYDVHQTKKDGEKVHFNIMAIATIEDGLITEWQQVAHQCEEG